MPCNTTINAFLIDRCTKTPPGVQKVLLTRAAWILAYGTKDDYPTTGAPNTISTAITLDTTTFPTASWVQWQSAKEKAGFLSETQGDFGASTYSSRLELFMPGGSAELSYVLDESLDDELIALYQLPSGTWRLLGDLSTPAFIRFDQTTGKARGDEVGYNVTIEVPIHSDPFAFYTGTIPS